MSGDFETVAWVYDAGELALLRSLFEWAEIPLMLVGHGHASVQWNVMIALGGVRLRVRQADVPAALDLLANLERSPQASVRFFARDKLVDVLLVLLLLVIGCLAPPARVQAEFAYARPERARREA